MDGEILQIPYVHCTSHRLKKVAGRYNTDIVFSAGRKLGSICQSVQRAREPGDRPDPNVCGTRHHSPSVVCQKDVVYEVPLSCASECIGQTKRCLNERHMQHKRSLKYVSPFSNLGLHCQEHKCKPLFADSTGIFSHNSQTVQEIAEAYFIIKSGAKCVSKTSISLHEREFPVLDKIL